MPTIKAREICIVGAFCGAAALSPLWAMEYPANPNPPDLSPDLDGWRSYGTEFLPAPSGPRPVTFDPAHPYVRNDSRGQPTLRVADVNNPNLTQWSKDKLKKSNDEVFAGKAIFSRNARCWATGVPAFLLNQEITYFLQTPKEVVLIWDSDHQVRHVYLNVPHSDNPKPSWYGESVGRYEGDTLVVDTIGQNTQTFLDNYRTPHSERLHVIERFHRIEGGKILQADVTIEDPVALKQPLQVIQRWRHGDRGSLNESSCAEGNFNYFNQDVEPMPIAARPEF
jgi:hypothetical protein